MLMRMVISFPLEVDIFKMLHDILEAHMNRMQLSLALTLGLFLTKQDLMAFLTLLVLR